MKILKQTKLHTEEQDGNCWATCIACMLDLDEIPDLNVSNYMELTKGFINKHGYDLIEVQITPNLNWRIPNGLIAIVTGISPRQPRFSKDGNKDICHTIIGELSQEITDLPGNKCHSITKCEFIHDPHPDNTFIKTLEWVSIIINI